MKKNNYSIQRLLIEIHFLNILSSNNQYIIMKFN
jgi:hypothetical protein